MSSRNESRPEREIVRIDLTTGQKQVVAAATHREAEAIELTVDELEQRIAPTGAIPPGPTPPADFFRLAGNHNETLLTNDV